MPICTSALYAEEWLQCMELCLGTGEKPFESLWVKIGEQTNMGDFTASICYRLPDQEEQVVGSLL